MGSVWPWRFPFCCGNRFIFRPVAYRVQNTDAPGVITAYSRYLRYHALVQMIHKPRYIRCPEASGFARRGVISALIMSYLCQWFYGSRAFTQYSLTKETLAVTIVMHELRELFLSLSLPMIGRWRQAFSLIASHNYSLKTGLGVYLPIRTYIFHSFRRIDVVL